jgi:MIP family channel proteins
MTNRLIRECIAEFIGTFILVFIGAASVIVSPVFGIIVPALAHGLIVTGLIYTYGHISGAQFNPAVTLSLWVGGKQNAMKSCIFVGIQFIGGIIAAVVLVAVIPQDHAGVTAFLGEYDYNFGQTIGFLTSDAVWSAAVIEAILTFILVSVIYQSAVYNRAGNLAGIAVGFTLIATILAGGSATGASLNPARTLGPALMAGDTVYLIPYFVGVFLGGAVAGIMHSHIFSPIEIKNEAA